MFWGFQKLQILRVPADIEEVGLDASHHGGNAYPDLFHGYQFQDVEQAVSKHTKYMAQPAQTEKSPNGNDTQTMEAQPVHQEISKT